MTRIIMHGCNGKMGQVITDLVKADADAEIVAGIDDYGESRYDYPLYRSLDECDAKADVIVDFSKVSAIDALLEYAGKTGLPLVLCTTGLTGEQLAKVQKLSERTAVLKSANMSLGINLLMDLLRKAVKVLAPAGFDIEIVEKHHNQKVDAPSGTALALADVMNQAMDSACDYTYDRSQKRGKRGKNEIGISSVRGGTIVGEHEVIFAGTDEVIELKHTACSKAIFGKGALEAAKFLKGKTSGMYDMSDVISAG